MQNAFIFLKRGLRHATGRCVHRAPGHQQHTVALPPQAANLGSQGGRNLSTGALVSLVIFFSCFLFCFAFATLLLNLLTKLLKEKKSSMLNSETLDQEQIIL